MFWDTLLSRASSYLTDLSISAPFVGSSSSSKHLNVKVPEASVLGALLFFIHVTSWLDLSQFCDVCHLSSTVYTTDALILCPQPHLCSGLQVPAPLGCLLHRVMDLHQARAALRCCGCWLLIAHSFTLSRELPQLMRDFQADERHLTQKCWVDYTLRGVNGCPSQRLTTAGIQKPSVRASGGTAHAAIHAPELPVGSGWDKTLAATTSLLSWLLCPSRHPASLSRETPPSLNHLHKKLHLRFCS